VKETKLARKTMRNLEDMMKVGCELAQLDLDALK